MIGLGLVLLALALLAVTHEPRLSPDGGYYLKLAAGERVPRPYGLRWLLPLLLGGSFRAWMGCTYLSMLIAALTLGWWSGHWWAGGLLFLGLAGVRTSACFPILQDMPGLALLGVVLYACQYVDRWGWLGLVSWPALVMVMVGACINERLPLFAALLTGRWELLVGLVPVAIRWWWVPAPGPHEPEWLQHPIKSAWAKRQKDWWDIRVMILPWGMLLLGLLNWQAWTWQEWVVVGLAYGQVWVAQDAARLYVWAAPVLMWHTVQVMPEWGWAVALIAQWWNPWRRVV